ncbi:hypothetical protein Peur_017672 [Populus x canadensis]
MLHHYNKLHFRPLTGQVPGYHSTIFSLAFSVLALRDCLEWKSPMKMLSDVGCKFVFIAFFHTNSPHSLTA